MAQGIERLLIKEVTALNWGRGLNHCQAGACPNERGLSTGVSELV